MSLLGIDIGSTAMKAAGFDEGGRPIASARLEYRKPVQGADDWWRAAVRAVRQLLRTRPELGQGTEAIGLSGRGGTRVLLDRGARPLDLTTGQLSPAFMSRAVELAGSRRGGHGLRFLAALLQMRSEQPREFERAARAMVAKDYLVFQFTGHAVTDPASSLDRPDWPETVTAAREFQHIRFSEIRWPWEEAGRLREPVARQLGLRPGIPVATGAHDGAAAAVGAGAARAGTHAVTLGTNSVYRIISDRDDLDQNRFWSVLPGQTAYGADVTLGGYALEWITRMLDASHDRLAREAATIPPGAEGVVFLPQMGGRILPKPNANVAGAFAGIRRSTRQGHLYRAVLEGNAFALTAAREALLAQGLPDGPVYLTGGGTGSPLFRQVLADAFEQPVRWAGVEEGCRGAAVFAAVAAGTWPGVEEAAEAMTSGYQELHPGRESEAYRRAYAHYVAVRDSLDNV